MEPPRELRRLVKLLETGLLRATEVWGKVCEQFEDFRPHLGTFLAEMIRLRTGQFFPKN